MTVRPPLLGLEPGELADSDTRQTIEMPALAQHGELAIDLADLHLHRFEQQDRANERWQAQPAAVAIMSRLPPTSLPLACAAWSSAPMCFRPR